MDYTQTIGNVNELKCITAIMLLGYDCSIPYGNGAKYDFIADINGELLKFQCKSSSFVNDHGVVKEDSFSFSTVCLTTNTKETKRYTYNSDLIDYFITCFQDKIYVIPVEETGGTSKTLRFTPPNNGCKNWNNANDYLLENYFSYGSKYLESKENYLNRSISRKNENLEPNKCIICGKEISYLSTYCPKCASEKSRKTEWPSREELKELIRNNSFLSIGRMYEVSDNAVRSWCKSYELPYRAGDIKKISDNDWVNI